MSDPLASESDAVLLEQFSRTRSERVFEELMNRYWKLVMTVCMRTLRNQHDAEDAFQATFLVLAEKAATVRKRESLPSWLTGVAHRLSMNLSRKRHRKDQALDSEPESATDHFAELEQRFDTQTMDEELNALPERYRDALVRFYFLGQTSREIADALGITPGAADGRIKRGRQALRVRLARRGVALGVLTVAAVATETASASVAHAVMQSTLHSAATQELAACSSTALELAGTELMKKTALVSPALVASTVIALLGLSAFGLNAAFAYSSGSIAFPIETLTTTDQQTLAVAEVAVEAVPMSGQQAEDEEPEEPQPNQGAANSHFADLYESEELDLDETAADLKLKFPALTVKVKGTKLVVLGGLGDRKMAMIWLRVKQPNLRHAEVPVRIPQPERYDNQPPQFVTAKLSQDGKNVVIRNPNATLPAIETYNVRVPYREVVKDAAGKENTVTRFRTETRTKSVSPGDDTERPRTLLKISDLKITNIAGKEMSRGVLAKRLDGKEPVVMLSAGQRIGETWVKVLRPEIAVIHLPDGVSGLGQAKKKTPEMNALLEAEKARLELEQHIQMLEANRAGK